MRFCSVCSPNIDGSSPVYRSLPQTLANLANLQATHWDVCTAAFIATWHGDTLRSSLWGLSAVSQVTTDRLSSSSVCSSHHGSTLRTTTNLECHPGHHVGNSGDAGEAVAEWEHISMALDARRTSELPITHARTFGSM